ncbi:MAG: CHAT domain-containing protein [Ardenticatenaceae bacterium]|nr:CHAT domain-containing protein [Ardenticatenaceae bacterium]MCB9445242.1 CHAT domain-containing protein [Ardenticatenaceae bacterium]
MLYENFDLRVGRKSGDSYPVEVTRNPNNNEMYPVDQPFDPEDYDFADLVSYLEALVAKGKDAVEVGKKMHDFLFPPAVNQILFSNRQSMRDQGKGLRIRLRVDAPELSALPWEYCYADEFLALKRDTPFVRYIPRSFAADELNAPNPMKVLVAIAAPKDQAPLSVKQEESRIRKTLAFLGDRVQLTVIPNATASKLQGALAVRPHILHFIGHGTVDNGRSSIILEDSTGNSAPLDADQMMYLMGNTGVKVVILNACKTAKQDARNAILGVAPALVQAEIPAVIAMQFNVPDKTALGFTRDLYRFLVSGFPLDTAVTEMRIGAFIGAGDRYFWGIPVLFMRAPDGVIWQPDPELLKLFEQAQAEAVNMDEPDLAELLDEIHSDLEAIKSSLDSGDYEDSVDDLTGAQELVKESPPNARRIRRKLEGVKDILSHTDAAAELAGKLEQALSLVDVLPDS